jgi:hypothetical protein
VRSYRLFINEKFFQHYNIAYRQSDIITNTLRTTEEGETYEITKTWIGDIGVGTAVTLEGVVGQGEWYFVTGETSGG